MRRHARTHRAAWVIALSFALTVLAAIPASAATPTMTASLTPGSANAGAQTAYSLTVKSNQGSLRSLSLAAPAGFYVESATSSSGNPQVAGNQTVNVTGLNISGSNTVMVTITAFPKCTPGSPNTWTLNAAQNGGTAYVPVHLLDHGRRSRRAASSCSGRSPTSSRTSRALSQVAAVRANDTVDPTYTGSDLAVDRERPR